MARCFYEVCTRVALTSSWFELWDREQAVSQTALNAQRNVASRNIGALELKITHRFKVSVDAEFLRNLHADSPLVINTAGEAEEDLVAASDSASPVEIVWPQKVESDLSGALERGLSGSQGDLQEPLKYLDEEEEEPISHERSGWM